MGNSFPIEYSKAEIIRVLKDVEKVPQNSDEILMLMSDLMQKNNFSEVGCSRFSFYDPIHIFTNPTKEVQEIDGVIKIGQSNTIQETSSIGLTLGLQQYANVAATGSKTWQITNSNNNETTSEVKFRIPEGQIIVQQKINCWIFIIGPTSHRLNEDWQMMYKSIKSHGDYEGEMKTHGKSEEIDDIYSLPSFKTKIMDLKIRMSSHIIIEFYEKTNNYRLEKGDGAMMEFLESKVLLPPDEIIELKVEGYSKVLIPINWIGIIDGKITTSLYVSALPNHYLLYQINKGDGNKIFCVLQMINLIIPGPGVLSINLKSNKWSKKVPNASGVIACKQLIRKTYDIEEGPKCRIFIF